MIFERPTGADSAPNAHTQRHISVRRRDGESYLGVVIIC
jgi:hypothetical protein